MPGNIKDKTEKEEEEEEEKSSTNRKPDKVGDVEEQKEKNEKEKNEKEKNEKEKNEKEKKEQKEQKDKKSNRLTLYSSFYSDSIDNISNIFNNIIASYGVTYDLAALGIEAHYYTLYLIANAIHIINTYIENLRKTFGVKVIGNKVMVEGDRNVETKSKDKVQLPKDKSKEKDNSKEDKSEEETTKNIDNKKSSKEITFDEPEDEENEKIYKPNILKKGKIKKEIYKPDILRKDDSGKRNKKTKSRRLLLYSRSYYNDKPEIALESYQEIEKHVLEKIILVNIEEHIIRIQLTEQKGIKRILEQAVDFYDKLHSSKGINKIAANFFGNVKNATSINKSMNEKAKENVLSIISGCILNKNTDLRNIILDILSASREIELKFVNRQERRDPTKIKEFSIGEKTIENWHSNKKVEQKQVESILGYKQVVYKRIKENKDALIIGKINFAHYYFIKSLYSKTGIVGKDLFDTICSEIKNYVHEITKGKKSYKCEPVQQLIKEFNENVSKGKYFDEDDFGIIGELALFLKKKLDKLDIEVPGFISMPGKLLEKGLTCLAIRNGYESLLKKADRSGDKELKKAIVRKIKKDISFRNQAGLETKCLEKLLRKYDVYSY